MATGQGEDPLKFTVAEVFQDRQEEHRVWLHRPGFAAVEIFWGDLHVIDAQFEATDDFITLGCRGDIGRNDEAHLDRRSALI